MKAKSGDVQYKALRSDISAGKIGRLYIFYGEEAYLLRYCLGLLKEKLVNPGTESFNYHVFEGKGLNLSQLEEAVSLLPAMGGGKLVIVRDYDLYKADSSSRAFLERLFEVIPEECCLVFVYDLIEYKPDARMKLHDIIRQNGIVSEFSRQSQADLISWIGRRFQSWGKGISPKLAEYLIFLCGGLMEGLISEIEKIAAYSGGDTITQSDIDAVAVPELDAVTFDLTDAIAQGRFDRAMELLQQLISMKTEPVLLLGAIGKQLRQLYSARLAIDEGRSTGYLMKLWGFRSSYPAERLFAEAGRISPEWCRRAVALCAQTDVELKSSGADKQTSIETLLFKLSLKEEHR